MMSIQFCKIIAITTFVCNFLVNSFFHTLVLSIYFTKGADLIAIYGWYKKKI